jgi:hypothetical protein
VRGRDSRDGEAGGVDLLARGGASEAAVVGGPVPDRRMSSSPVKCHGRLRCVARMAAAERHGRRSCRRRQAEKRSGVGRWRASFREPSQAAWV